MPDAPVRSLLLHVASRAPSHCVSRSLPASASPWLYVALTPSGVCIVSCRAVTTERLPSSEPELINDNQWRQLFREIVQRPGEYEFSGSNVNDGIPPCLQWPLDESPLQYYGNERRMHVADRSKQACMRTSNDKKQRTATPVSAEVVRLSAYRSLPEVREHGHTLTFHLVAYCMIPCTKTTVKKKVQTRATFERLLRKVAEKARRIHEQHHLPEESTVIIIVDKKPSLPSKGICINARTTLRDAFILEERDNHVTSQIRQTS